MKKLVGFCVGMLAIHLTLAAVQSPIQCHIFFDGTNTVQLRWNAYPGKNYVLQSTSNLLSPWTSTPTLVATSNSLAYGVPATAQAQFFKVVKLDTDGPVVAELTPNEGNIAVDRQSPVRARITDQNGINTNSLSLKVGTNAPVTLADARLSYADGLLAYTPGADQFLGNYGAFVTNTLIAADTLGNWSTNTWSFQLALQTVLSTNIVFIGGGTPIPRGPQPGPGETLTLISTNGNYFTFSYTGASCGLSNGMHLVKSDLRTGFTRTVISFTEYASSNTVVVLTRPTKLAELLQQGSLQSATFTELPSPSPLPEGPQPGSRFGAGLALNYNYSLERVIYQDGLLVIGLSPASKLDLGAAFNLSANFSGFKLTAFEAAFSGSADLTLEAYVYVGAAYSRSGQKGLITPIHRFYGTSIGPVPVWVEIVFEVNAGYELNLGASAGYTNGFNAVKQIKVGRRWDTKKGWTAIWENPELGFTLLGPTWQVEASGSIQVYLQPKVTVLVYSAAGASADLKPYAELSGRVQLNPYEFELGLYAGLTSTIALDLRVWDDAWGDLPSVTFDLIPRTQLWAYKSAPVVPQISAQPQPQAVTVGDPATFTVQAGGQSPLSYRWQRDDLNLSEDGRITGTRGSVLRITEAQTNDAGSYRVVVSNPNGAVTSSKALLTLYPTSLRAGAAAMPTGGFTMGDTFAEGDAIERPTHTVYVSAFSMDKYTVTKALWNAVRAWGLTNGYTDLPAGSSKGATHPVHTINWFDCVKWCNARSEMEGRIPAYYTNAEQTAVYRTGRVDVRNDQVKWTAGYRLATEAEWEKAARGGTTGRRYPWSDSNGISHSRANYGWDPNFQAGGMPYTSPVGYFAANAYGLYDTAGNVFAWCWDWGAPYSSATQTNPRGPATGSGRIIRGGGWAGYESDCRTAYRTIYTTWEGGPYLGFRTVLPLSQ